MHPTFHFQLFHLWLTSENQNRSHCQIQSNTVKYYPTCSIHLQGSSISAIPAWTCTTELQITIFIHIHHAESLDSTPNSRTHLQKSCASVNLSAATHQLPCMLIHKLPAQQLFLEWRSFMCYTCMTSWLQPGEIHLGGCLASPPPRSAFKALPASGYLEVSKSLN